MALRLEAIALIGIWLATLLLAAGLVLWHTCV